MTKKDEREINFLKLSEQDRELFLYFNLRSMFDRLEELEELVFKLEKDNKRQDEEWAKFFWRRAWEDSKKMEKNNE